MVFWIKISINCSFSNANYKQLKIVLAPKVKKVDPVFLISKLGKFLLFDSFLDLANFSLFNFSDLSNFFDFSNFLAYSILLLLNLLILLLLLFFPEADLLLLFLPRTGLSDLIVFNIKMNKVTILLKL